jgi:hypothetical protein
MTAISYTQPSLPASQSSSSRHHITLLDANLIWLLGPHFPFHIYPGLG